MGFLEVLTVVFVVLKLTGHIVWSWFWVISPMYPALLIYVLWFASLIFVGTKTSRSIRRGEF